MVAEKEKQEAADIVGSRTLKDDMKRLRENRHNPFTRDGKFDIDRYIEFLNEYNSFINHMPKAFKPIKDRFMKL